MVNGDTLALIYVGMVIATVWIADTKGRHPLRWGILGLLFGPIALFIVAMIPSVKK